MSRDAETARIVRAAFLYFAVVFGAGFVLGTVRILVLVPRIGALGAVLVETPLMLAISWAACRWVLARLAVGPAIGGRLAMGGLAFVLLVGAELLLAVAGFGATSADFFRAYATPAGMVGLAAQLVFAAMPLVASRKPRRQG